ncbi:phosphotriesterase family protein [Labedella endophytica]|uniref:Aryldialkylphosphatase n=1 Tax=Labedella endophytica TaxID=1523160 RepID=A0A433JTH1_9MICO|nr:aryldialkylphosphatase [Labedella endophytica]RUR01682.1 aryldialkylphosphatase [Labedella endophytica]
MTEAATGVVRTVLGDRAAGTLGRVNVHEHLFQATPLLPGDDLDDERASAQEAGALRDSGFDAMVDATPVGLGRRTSALARISSSTVLTIVASTGMHRSAHYPAGHPQRALDVDAKSALFMHELTVGMLDDDADAVAFAGVSSPSGIAIAVTPGGRPVRAGLIKTGIDYWAIDDVERSTLEAAATAHRATGAPLMVHLEYCSAAHEVLDLLEGDGVAAERIVLAHADRDPDAGLHLSLAERGAHLGYDGMGRSKTRSDAELLALTRAVVEGGGGGRILLGNDVARRSRYLAYGGMPGLGYLGRRYLPRLRAEIGDAAVERMLTETPARFLAWSDS